MLRLTYSSSVHIDTSILIAEKPAGFIFVSWGTLTVHTVHCLLLVTVEKEVLKFVIYYNEVRLTVVLCVI